MSNQQDQNKRISRVEREIREIVATFLTSGFRTGLKGLVTVSRVWVSKDLRIARVYVTLLGGDEKPQEAADILNENIREVQQAVAREMRTKFVPKLEFFYDDTLEKSLKVQGLIRQLEEERKSKGEPATPTDSETESD